MASTKLAFLAIVVLLLQVSWCAQQGGAATVMAVTSFEAGPDESVPAACDGTYHSNGDPLAALSMVWYAGGSQCLKKIKITSSQNANSLVALVVDECDSQSGCKDNVFGVVATFKGIWAALGRNACSR